MSSIASGLPSEGSQAGQPLVAVLGASGYIGSAVLGALARQPIRVRAVARRPSASPAGARALVEVRTADLLDPAALAAAVEGADAIVHLVMHSASWRSAESEPVSERVNVAILSRLLDILGRREREVRPVLLWAGSSSQVGRPDRLPVDGSEPDRPETAYDRQKQQAELALKEATAAGLVRGVSLRLPTVYGCASTGAQADRGVVATMIGRALAGEPLTMWHDGSIERDLLHVTDVAEAFIAGLAHADTLGGRHWLLGSGCRTPLGQLFIRIAQLVAARTGEPEVAVLAVPPPVDVPPTDLRSMVVDPAPFRSVTGWQARVPLDRGLAATVAALAAPGGA